MSCWVVWSGCCHSLSSCHWTLSCSKTQQYFQTFSKCIALILRVNYRTGDSASYVWRVAELSWSLIARSKGYFPFPHPLPVKSSLSRDQTMIPPSPFDLAKSTCEWNDWFIDWLIDWLIFLWNLWLTLKLTKSCCMTFNFTWTIYTYLLGLAIGFKLYECFLDEKKYSFKIWFHGAKYTEAIILKLITWFYRSSIRSGCRLWTWEWGMGWIYKGCKVTKMTAMMS